MVADIWSSIYWVGALFPGFCVTLVMRRMRWLYVDCKKYIVVPGKMCLWVGNVRVRNRDGLPPAEGLYKKEESRVFHQELLSQSPGNGAR